MARANKVYSFNLNKLYAILDGALFDVLKNEPHWDYHARDYNNPTYRELISNIIVGFLKEKYFVNKVLNTGNEYELNFFRLLTLLKVDYERLAKEEDKTIGDLYCREFTDNLIEAFSSIVFLKLIEDPAIYLLDPYMEWEILRRGPVLLLKELGDYRIRRYEELVRDGIIKK